MAASMWTDVWTPVEEPRGNDRGEENLRGWVSTKEEAEEVRRRWQVANSITFVGDRKGKAFGSGILHLQNADGMQIHTPRIRFADVGEDKVVPSDGVPFAIVSRYSLRCMYAKDKNQAAKRRNEELAEKAMEEDHSPPKKRKYRHLQGSKKKGCPAMIEMKEVIRFTDFDLNDDSGMTKRAISDHIHLALKSGEKFNFEQRIYIELPSDADHQSVHTIEKMEDKRPLILCTILPTLPTQRALFDKHFRAITWQHFLADPEAYREDVQGILHVPLIVPEITETLLRSMPKLKVLATHSKGTNHLDLPLLKACGLKVSHVRGVLEDTCADFFFGLLIAAARRIPECMTAAQGYGRSPTQASLAPLRHNKVLPTGVKITGATLGILGMGDIGYEVARRASGFKMRVLYHNRNRRSAADEAEVKAAYCASLDEMLPEVDFLVIAASLNDASKQLIGKKQLALMKSSAIIINGARGLILDHDALVEALCSGTIRGAALDATSPEPLHHDHPLLHMPNVIVTAHLAPFVEETLVAMMQNCIDNILAGLEGRPLLTEISQ